MEISANEVAEWMLNEVKQSGILYQKDAVDYIKKNFGESLSMSMKMGIKQYRRK